MTIDINSSAIGVGPLVGELGCRRGKRAGPLLLTDDNGTNPCQPDETGNNTVDDLTSARAPVGALGQFESKATVENTKSDEDTTDPDVSVRPDGAALDLLEEKVVHVSENGHEEDNSKEDHTDDGVVGPGLVEAAGEVDTETGAGNVGHVAKDLECAVNPDHAGHGDEANGDGASREKNNKRKGREDAVGNELFAAVGDGASGGDGCDARVGVSVARVGVRVARVGRGAS